MASHSHNLFKQRRSKPLDKNSTSLWKQSTLPTPWTTEERSKASWRTKSSEKQNCVQSTWQQKTSLTSQASIKKPSVTWMSDNKSASKWLHEQSNLQLSFASKSRCSTQRISVSQNQTNGCTKTSWTCSSPNSHIGNLMKSRSSSTIQELESSKWWINFVIWTLSAKSILWRRSIAPTFEWLNQNSFDYY